MRYIVVFAGARDNYQVAQALAESGKLARLVTEFYFDKAPWWLRALLAFWVRGNRAGARRCAGVPVELVSISFPAMAVWQLGKILRLDRVRARKDAVLGAKAGALATREGCGILAYSYYASYAFDRVPRDRLRIIFQVHPHPEPVRRILNEEIKLTPVARESLQREHELGSSARTLQRLARESQQADYVITPSSFARQTLIEAGVGAERIAVVPYGIDAGVFAPKNFGANQVGRPLRLIFVGSLVQRKGLSYLLEAMRRLRGGNVELVLAGRGGRDEPLLRHFADVPFRVLWNASRGDLVRELQAADVFVFPSLVESFGHVILEAMAVGLPIITTTNTAGPDLLEEGRTGFVGPIRDVDFIEGKIRWFMANRDAASAMGRACQKEAGHRTWPDFRVNLCKAVEIAEGQWQART